MEKQKYIVFAIAWMVLFLLQAWWTPPHIDELYYWRFSQELDWGFFDHPPMVALLIKISDFLFNGGLGIRFVTVLMTTASIYFIYLLTDRTIKPMYFWIVIFMLPLFHVYGFITTPDVPLLFFGSLFFLFYKRILIDRRWLDYILWGIIMGLMLYSKYHGALLIIFTLISNPKLFLKPKTYVAGAIGLLIWAPHVLWQYEHNWMTFRFHLSERVGVYEWFFPLEYLGNLLFVFNPLFIVFLYKIIKKRWNGEFEKTLYFVLVGFIIFFGYQSFKDHVQPQWLIIATIPYIILMVNGLKKTNLKLLKRLFLIFLPILIFLHIIASFDVLNSDITIFRNDEFVEQIKLDAQDRPVVFMDSYQDPSRYAWYNPGSLSHSFNRGPKRKNQFNIWMQDTLMNGKEVYVFAPEKYGIPEYVTYRSFDKLKVQMLEDSTLAIENPYHYPFTFSEDEYQMEMILYRNKLPVKYVAIDIGSAFSIPPNSTTSTNVRFNTPIEGDFDVFGFSVKIDPWPGAAVYYRYKYKH